ncbi:ApbE family lipoprotein [Desulfatibacillum aliphaticivorans]|uniref:FAD:protein FMN transferase n=2 Tax=Desulfatibacillum aliphaticivorans TaxID=218208 RepID=B8FDU9_DESAL|nr:ApbE family lipoprotein [Desulfatibacillum aliphaticivorans]
MPRHFREEVMFEPFDRKVDRRNFLKISGMLGVGVAATTVMPVSEALAFDKGLHKVTRTKNTMGTLVAITVMHPSVDQADAAIEKAYAEMERVTRLLDRFDSASPVAALNRDGKIDGMPEEMAQVLTAANYYHRISGGTFDVTVKPVVDLYQETYRKTGKVPATKAIEEAVALVDGGMLQLDVQDGKLMQRRSARLMKPGMGVTLDGIAKGYVIDAGAKALEQENIAHALINAGGDIRAIGGKGSDRAWTVAVRHPDKDIAYADKIRMQNGAVATSGNYEIYFDKERLYHHIVKPTDGMSPHELASASVWAKDVTTADALSTTVFVMGSHKGTRFIESLPDCEALVISRINKKTATKGWKSAA